MSKKSVSAGMTKRMNETDQTNQDMVRKLFQPPAREPIFQSGQKVRVISQIDVNFPSGLDYWLNTICEVKSVDPCGFGANREWSYLLQHPDGHTCRFKEQELDRRYRRRPRQAN